MKSKISIKIQGVKGGNPQWKENIGYANTFIDNDQNFILADAFKGTGQNYTRRDKTKIIIGNNLEEFEFDSFDELLNFIKYNKKLIEALKLAKMSIKEIAPDAYKYGSVGATIDEALNQIILK